MGSSPWDAMLVAATTYASLVAWISIAIVIVGIGASTNIPFAGLCGIFPFVICWHSGNGYVLGCNYIGGCWLEILVCWLSWQRHPIIFVCQLNTCCDPYGSKWYCYYSTTLAEAFQGLVMEFFLTKPKISCLCVPQCSYLNELKKRRCEEKHKIKKYNHRRKLRLLSSTSKMFDDKIILLSHFSP